MNCNEDRLGRRRRTAISAQAVTKERIDKWDPPSFPKTEKERRNLLQSMDSYKVLFGQLANREKLNVIDAMFKIHVEKGAEIIRQGDEGDNFYVIEEGTVEFHVKRRAGTEDFPTKVGEGTKGCSFGELALMYNAPRAATVKAKSSCTLWGLDRDSFQLMIVSAEKIKKRTYEEFLGCIEIFNDLTKLEIVQLSDMLNPIRYRPGELVVKEGEYGSRFYLIEEGRATCVVGEGDKELVVSRYSTGGYFGELALLGDGIRKASVFAETSCTILYVEKAAFDRVLRPVKRLLENGAQTYRQVQTEKHRAMLERYSSLFTDQPTTNNQ